MIHKYEKDKEARAKEFYEMFQEEGAKMKKYYQRETRKHEHAGSRASNAGSDRKSDFMRAATMQKQRRSSLMRSRDGDDAESENKRGSYRGTALPQSSINEMN